MSQENQNNYNMTEITYYGHSTFLIIIGNKKILFDKETAKKAADKTGMELIMLNIGKNITL